MTFDRSFTVHFLFFFTFLPFDFRTFSKTWNICQFPYVAIGYIENIVLQKKKGKKRREIAVKKNLEHLKSTKEKNVIKIVLTFGWLRISWAMKFRRKYFGVYSLCKEEMSIKYETDFRQNNNALSKRRFPLGLVISVRLCSCEWRWTRVKNSLVVEQNEMVCVHSEKVNSW